MCVCVSYVADCTSTWTQKEVWRLRISTRSSDVVQSSVGIPRA